MWKKQILARARNPKRKLGVTTDCSEEIEPKFGIKNVIHSLYFKAFLE